MLLERIGEELFVRHQIACGDSATFQGKERDIMFVSMVEAPNSHVTKTGLMFQQRFNVALSRARDRMYLVRSVDEQMLKPDDLKAKVIRHFKDPMQGGPVNTKDALSLCDSDFEREVYGTLAERGWRVRPQVRAGDYHIDLVVEGAEDRRLAIELDGDKYHGLERWAEDYRRQLALERMGWRFWRCWGSSWTLDPEGCLADLEETLGSVGIAPLGSDAIPTIYTEHRVAGGVEDEKTEEHRIETEPELAVAQVDPEGPVKASAEPLPFSEAVRPAGIPQPAMAGDFLIEDDRVVEVGDRVVVSYNDDPGNPKTLVLTQEQDDDPNMGIIFVGRPLAKALIGQSEEEVVDLPAGDRVREATILRIEKHALAA